MHQHAGVSIRAYICIRASSLLSTYMPIYTIATYSSLIWSLMFAIAVFCYVKLREKAHHCGITPLSERSFRAVFLERVPKAHV